VPIQTEDIKLLKSAVMADVPEGGGAMTGAQIIDGLSNNLFTDTSSMDRGTGRTQVRKLFGVAHSDDTDTLLGAHAIVTKAPADPRIHCALIKTGGWADMRSAAQAAIEKYVVKGPHAQFQLYDTHYAESLQLRLISALGGTPPAGGDALVLVNPDGAEQAVRILKVSTIKQDVAMAEGGGVVIVNATVATCDIGNALDKDFFGPPAHRAGIDEDLFAKVYTTNIAGGARFYGIKPLGLNGAVGDYAATTSGGIYAPIVPAATVESPLVDLYPLAVRGSLSRTALRSVTLPAAVMDLGVGAALLLPTPMEPGSVSISHAGTVFGDDGAGVLKLGAVAVGAIDYAGKRITVNLGSYGLAACEVTYRPATPGGAATHSAGVKVTTANQGRVYTHAFEPPPAPGTLGVSYMAQARWYDMADNANGRLAGADPAYGVGSINYDTGSASVTLGAIPDVGGTILYQWGDASAAAPYAGAAPTRLSALLDLPWAASLATITLAWTVGGVARAATCDASGNLSGDASGKVAATYKLSSGTWQYVNEVAFEPAAVPDGAVTASWTAAAATSSTATSSGSGNYALAQTPVAPGSVALTVACASQDNFDVPASLYVVDNGAGVLIAPNQGGAVVGSVNYATGAVHLNDAVALSVYERLVKSYAIDGSNAYYEWRELRVGHACALLNSSIAAISHRKAGAGAASSVVVALPAVWEMQLPVPAGLTLGLSGLVFTVGGAVYAASAGALSRGWSVATGAADAAAGTVLGTGRITVAKPPAGSANDVVLVSASVDKSGSLTVGQGVFRVASTPLKVGVFQIQAGALVGSADDAGLISGGGWEGRVDYQRGIVEWSRVMGVVTGYASWQAFAPIAASALSYNAVFLQYLPLDKDLLGLDTVRLPLDGKVPIFRAGDLVVVHNTLSTQLPNPLVKGTAYSLGRERIASVRVKDALGAIVPSSLYASDLNPGTLAVKVGSDITPYTQPLTVENRIEDMVQCVSADISGQLKFASSLTHAYPAGTSFVSGVLAFGDMFARVYGDIEQETWTGEWSDELIGSAPLSSFNAAQYPITTTNRGAITERWALIFSTSGTAFRIVGESVGVIGTGTINAECAPINPATGAPYFRVPEGGWGAGWSTGNVLRFNTMACGAPFWAVRTILQGPASVDSDVFELAFRSDTDRP